MECDWIAKNKERARGGPFSGRKRIKGCEVGRPCGRRATVDADGLRRFSRPRQRPTVKVCKEVNNNAYLWGLTESNAKRSWLDRRIARRQASCFRNHTRGRGPHVAIGMEGKYQETIETHAHSTSNFQVEGALQASPWLSSNPMV